MQAYKAVLRSSRPLDTFHHLQSSIAIRFFIKAAPGYQKSSPSYKFNSLNFDSEKLSVETLWDHLNIHKKGLTVFNLVVVNNLSERD